MIKVLTVICSILLVGVLFYALSLIGWEAYWEKKCLGAGLLGARTTYSYDIFCFDGNKSVRVKW